MNIETLNIHGRFLFHYFVEYQGAWLLNCLKVHLVCKKLTHYFLSSCTILHSHSCEWEFLLLQILTSIWCCQCSNCGHSYGYIAIFHCFSLHFPMTHDKTSFHVLLFKCMFFFLMKCHWDFNYNENLGNPLFLSWIISVVSF